MLGFCYSFSESSSDHSRLNDKLMAILDGTDTAEIESPNDRKKSGVKFNELVERIEVLTDDLKDNNSFIMQSDDEDNNEKL